MSEATLNDWISKLRKLEGFVEASAPELADTMKGELGAQVDAGKAPDGSSWQLTEAGARPLKRAATKLFVRAVGSVILATLTGHHVFHHYGTKKDPQRQILPTAGGLPATLAEAFRAGIAKRFRRTMGGQ